RDQRRRIARGLELDVLCISGGVSVGDRDRVADLLRRERVEIVFHRLRLKPAKPTLFGRRGLKLVFGLPGNPVSTFVAAEILVKRALRRLARYPVRADSPLLAIVAADLAGGGEREEYRPARAWIESGEFRVAPVAFRGSSDFPSLCAANAFIVVAEKSPSKRAGERTPIHLLADR